MNEPDSTFRHPERAEREGNKVPAQRAWKESGCTVSHVADWNRHHPGEMVIFYTRVEIEGSGVTKPVPGLTLEISLPKELILDSYRAIGSAQAMPLITTVDGAHHLIWQTLPASVSTCYEYQVEARVAPTQHDLILESHAVLGSGTSNEWSVLDQETATVAVSTTSEYLRYLPAIYQEDDLMGRFLMLFGSFWKPLERQIDDLWLYFDPQLTPSDFLPWLASWLSLALDESWPEEKQRQLIRSAIFLYRKRGTKQGLEEYLTIYTGVKPHIVERRAYDFRLGPESRFGARHRPGQGQRAAHLCRHPPSAASRVRREGKSRKNWCASAGARSRQSSRPRNRPTPVIRCTLRPIRRDLRFCAARPIRPRRCERCL